MTSTTTDPRPAAPSPGPAFGGAKLALVCRGRVLTLRRDDRPDIPFPGCHDLPGGGREGGETPVACALRETREELGLVLDPGALSGARHYPRTDGPPGVTWLFLLRDDRFDPARIRFGDEGQGWTLMPLAAFCASPRSVPALARRLADWQADGWR